MNVTAVILAAGRGTRFEAGDKLMATWRGRALIEYPISAASAARSCGLIGEIVVVARSDSPVVRIASAAGCRVVHPDPAHGNGLSASLKAGVGTVRPDAAAALILLGDQPTVELAAISQLLTAADPLRSALVRARYPGTDDPGHPVLIGRDHFDLVNRASADRGVNGVTAAAGLQWTEVDCLGTNPDIDREGDLTALG